MNDFKIQKDCIYKSEHYSVRDNGAVFRHSRENKPIRKHDNVWTFGTPNKYGYLLIGAEVVHRIVATAFHGEPPSPQYIVDHIDTNRHNNRPENLRWLTKLENILNNPITKKRIIKRCGSIEAFLENPSILKNHVSDDPNFEWMRAVSPEEAQNAWNRLSDWASKEDDNNVQIRGKLGEWLYQGSNSTDDKTIDIESETPSAVQRNWKTPCEFPLCPQEKANFSISKYYTKLKIGEVFSTNQFSSTLIEDFAISNNGKTIWVMGVNSDKETMKQWTLAQITFENNHFVHESLGSFVQKVGAEKQFTIVQGIEWTGGETFDELI